MLRLKKQVGRTWSDEKRRAYQRQYYKDHIDDARAYQREYSRKLRRGYRGKYSGTPWQGIRKEVYTKSDIQQMSPERLVRLMNEKKLILA